MSWLSTKNEMKGKRWYRKMFVPLLLQHNVSSSSCFLHVEIERGQLFQLNFLTKFLFALELHSLRTQTRANDVIVHEHFI